MGSPEAELIVDDGLTATASPLSAQVGRGTLRPGVQLTGDYVLAR